MVALSLVLALGLAACGDDDDDGGDAQPTPTTAPAPQGQPVVSIDMVDHAFQVSGPLVAGGTLRLSNKGTEFHMIAIGKFKPGKTMSDLTKVLSEAGPPGGGGGGEGGPTTTEAAPRQQPGTSTTSTTSSTRSGATTTTARGGTTSTTAAAGDEEGEQDPTADILEEIGLPGAFMGPGESAEVTAPNLAPGSYALLCFIPTEGEGTPHFAKGMVNQLEVVAGPAPAPPTADATYKLAAGKAIEGPATLTPGRHTLRIDAEPGSEQLEPVLARLNAGATIARLDAAFEDLFEGEEPPPKGAAATVPGQVVFGGFDLGPVTSFYLTVDLKAGNYVLVAEDTDGDTTGTPKELLALRVA
jgi:hypothetical protein